MKLTRRLAVVFGLGLILASSFCFAAESANDLQFRRLLSEQGVSTGTVETFHQDSYGYMCMGGDGGTGLISMMVTRQSFTTTS